MFAILAFVLSTSAFGQDRPVRQRPDVISIPPMGVAGSRGVQYSDCIDGQYVSGRAGRGLATEMAAICAGHLERQSMIDGQIELGGKAVDKGTSFVADGQLIVIGDAAVADRMYARGGMSPYAAFGASNSYGQLLAYRQGASFPLAPQTSAPAPAAPPPAAADDSAALRADLAASKKRTAELKKELDTLKGCDPLSDADGTCPAE